MSLAASSKMPLTQWFEPFRENIVGVDLKHQLSGELRPVVYADWTASGRLYRPIERFISETLGPYVANTHTASTLTGCAMTRAYEQAKNDIKRAVGADDNDAIIMAGAGMTAVVNKLQRMMGLRRIVPDTQDSTAGNPDRPLVFITHFEHHSNQTTWEECDVDLIIIERGDDGLPDLDHLRAVLDESQDRTLRIGSFSACSNVTGIMTPYHQMAEIMHQAGGLCFIDFATSAPYVEMDMHPANPAQKLDAIFFSPHKFLGGPGSSGVLVFDQRLYQLEVPDQPGGGTVAWTDPWGGHRFFKDIEIREDGGTPGFLQAIRAALAFRLKLAMGVNNMLAREEEIKQLFYDTLCRHDDVEFLEERQMNRLAIFSFYSLHVHHNLLVKLLNDHFGIQGRGGCSCAGTYGHLLLKIDPERSHRITAQIDAGDLSFKPGWVRISLHPTMTDDEVRGIANAIHQVLDNVEEWSADYHFDTSTGEFVRRDECLNAPQLDDFRALL